MTRRIVVSVVDYGAGNLHSLAKALEMPDVSVRIEPDPRRAANRREFDLLVLPGVGAFGAAAAHIAPARDLIREAVADGLSVVGICLGMQLLLDASAEGPGLGLGLVPGIVRRLHATRVPQIGWNTLERARESWPSPDGAAPEVAYFANSYVCQPDDDACITAWTTYDGDRFPASITSGPNDNVVGVQYHPEKSSSAGVHFLRALVSRAAGVRWP